MKQVLIRRGSPLVADVPAPQLTDDTLLVEVRFSIISTGTEMAGLGASPKSVLREAIHDPAKVALGFRMIRETGLKRTVATVKTAIDLGTPTGYSCAGLVVGCGRNIRGFSAGDRVACGGAAKANHAEIVAIPQNLAVHVPEECDLESAASATLGAIAMQGVRRADPRLGEFVAVIGLGLIGQLTMQILRVSGCRTIGIDIAKDRIEIARKFGMQAGVNSEESDPVQAVMQFTEGMGADAVIVAASSQSTAILQQAMQMVRRKGRVVVVGAVPLQVDRSPFYDKEADLLISCSYGPGRYDFEYEERGLDYPYAYVRWTENRNMAEYLRLLAAGSVDFRSLIEKRWPLDDAVQAYGDLKENNRIAVLLSAPEGAIEQKLASRVAVVPEFKSLPGVIRVGVIGPGSFSRAVHLPNLKQLSGRYSIAAILGRTGSSAWNIAGQYGAGYATTNVDDVFKDPEIDMVLIASRHDTHARLATEAIRHGKAVLLEKPAALNAAELEELVTATRSAGKPLLVGFNRRFSPFIRDVKSLLDQRTGPAVITYRMNAGALRTESWIQGPEGGGRVIGEACHIFDLFNFLIGDVPKEVGAMSVHLPSSPTAQTDNFSASLRYPDGSLCTLNYTSLGSAELGKEAMEVFFDGKTIVMDDFRRLLFYGIPGKPITKSHQDKGHLEELRRFADYLQGHGPSPMSLEEIEAATRTSFLVDELVRQGRMGS